MLILNSTSQMKKGRLCKLSKPLLHNSNEMKRLTFFLFCVLSVYQSVYADTSFIFSTDPQGIPVNTMSGKINIQASSPVTETTYLIPSSSSQTGQFVTSSGNPQTASIYIATGDSNRGIYYKDSIAGDFVLTVVVQNKAKTLTLATISQHIFIGVASSTSNSTTITDTATTTSQTVNSDSSTSSSSASAHSSPSSLSQMSEEMMFEISAGRDRLTTVGNEVTFRAVPAKVQNMSEQNIVYQWSFGDGTMGGGNVVNHTYRFAGDYSVLVNARYYDKQAVSRVKVSVVLPKVSLARVLGGVEVTNTSGVEINLEDWSLQSPKNRFVFPNDTLISNGKKITFADEVTGVNSGEIKLLNPIGKELATLVEETLVTVSEQSEQIGISTGTSLNDIQAKINEVKTKLAQISPQLPQSEPVKISQRVTLGKSKISTSTPMAPMSDIGVNSDKTEQTATVFEAPKQTGFISTIFSWPIRGFNFIRHLFVED